MSLYRKVSVVLFLIALVLTLSFIRESFRLFKPEEMYGELANIECVKKGRAERLSFSVITFGEVYELSDIGNSCFSYREFRQRNGEKAFIEKTQSRILSIKVNGEVYLSKTKTLFVGSLGGLIFIGLFFIPGLVLWKYGRKIEREGDGIAS